MCGRRRCLGGGGVVRFAQFVKIHVYRAKVGRSVVEVERNLVRAPLVVRVRRCALRRCH